MSNSYVLLPREAHEANFEDDLLECDCQTKTEEELLAEKIGGVSSPGDNDGSESEDDEKKGFVNASQYDPAPVS